MFNQIEISPLYVEPFFDGTLYYCLAKDIIPMAWLPVAGDRIFKDNSERSKKFLNVLLEKQWDTKQENMKWIFF
ncbi:hypothetical protein [Thermosipho melanesiensis]|uniref:hypothetical protein n=1 Tax=Thermosipho melanesiensis TaxID=46541 RepID=UPI0000ED2FD8|nr:hypothetical protein [Thermosipho melanesiensis]